jgi:hypothetical protein
MNEDLYKLIQQEGERFDIRKKEIAEKEKAQTECSSRMVEHARSIFGVDTNETVEHQIAHRWKIDNFNEHNLQTLMDHWQIYLASIITVKHTIRFTGSNFAANALFGFKQIRCHSPFYPFRMSCPAGYPRLDVGNVLKTSDGVTYELGKWFKHRSIDQSKLPLLFELTKDICKLIHDRNTFVTPEIRQAFNFVKSLYDSYHDGECYREAVKNIETYYNDYYGSIAVFNELNDRRKQLEDKWEIINKNYKIIIKLSNKKLRV